MSEVFIALGSNLGDRAANLAAAIAALPPAVGAIRGSPVYETDPQYVTDQPVFLNMVLRGETALDPHSLLRRLKDIEIGLGRVPAARNGPRLIDLDIVLFGDRIVDTPELIVPHPGLAERLFVLRPLADIAPLAIHPITGATVQQMLENIGNGAGIKPYTGSAVA